MSSREILNASVHRACLSMLCISDGMDHGHVPFVNVSRSYRTLLKTH